MEPANSYRALQVALGTFGAVMLLFYPLAEVWPSGWAWHQGPLHRSDYFMMIAGLYATLGVFLLVAARRPELHVSLIWFTVASSAVHAVIMAVQSLGSDHDRGHLWGDVPALLLVAVVLTVLLRSAGLNERVGPRPTEASPQAGQASR